MAKRKEKKLTPARPQLGDNVEILSAGEVLESAITDTLETNYMPYAMSVIVSRALPEIDGFKPAHRKLHNVRDGAAEGQPHQECQHRRQHDAPEPPRRRRDLRHDGPHGPLQREPACAFRGLQGQLRQGVQPRYGLRRRPIHRGQARAGLRRAVPRHRQGHRRFCAQLRRHDDGADAAARHFPDDPGQQHAGHRRRHGIQHLLLQPRGTLQCDDCPDEGPAGRFAGNHSGP